MIDPHWSLVDLDPRTWRNIGRFIEPPQYVGAAQPGEHGLFVLHNGERVLRVVDTERGVRRDLGLAAIDDPQTLAARLYETGAWQRVHVIDKRHLANVARLAQQIEQRALTLDAYYRQVFHLVWNAPGGYVSLPPHPGHWHGWTYAGVQNFVRNLPPQATLALAVLDAQELAIGLILDVHQGLIRHVTSFETFSRPPRLELSVVGVEQLWNALEARTHAGAPAPAAVLLCSQAIFDAWITAEDKLAVLQQGAQAGTAFWRGRDVS